MKKIHKEAMQTVHDQEGNHSGLYSFMQHKHLEMLQDMRKQSREMTRLKRKFELSQREKEQLVRERDRLRAQQEMLMSERAPLLQENISECNKKLIQSTASMETQIAELKDRAETEHSEKNQALEERSTRVQERLNGFMEQYELREKHFQSVLKSTQLELELEQARLKRQSQVAEEAKAKTDLLKAQVGTFAQTEAELRKQLNVYVEKFQQVEEALSKSNSLFQVFRNEMEAMAKRGDRLEKVNQAIRVKCDTMNKNLLEMAEERTSQQRELEGANKKITKLESLCRALHAERSNLTKKGSAEECLANSEVSRSNPSVNASTTTTTATAPSTTTTNSTSAVLMNGMKKVITDKDRGRRSTTTNKGLLINGQDATVGQHGDSLVVDVAMPRGPDGPTLDRSSTPHVRGNDGIGGGGGGGGGSHSHVPSTQGNRQGGFAPGGRPVATPGRLRQKQKRQQLQLFLQRCEHQQLQ
ncbi:hypothetical protein BGW38_010751 [Lunasporangiospora selenospora]|uniref:Alpha-taxilin n=1 Tax=Lunasporangiospora selenospora TaxID=979761 RepID=A0A9P6FWM4_9FUNG|nr:hypothetical protein BGW38_010751 [Lunasporangiospora selenospora]